MLDRLARAERVWNARSGVRASRILDGSVPEWPMGSGCKPDGLAYGGSNPSWPTKVNPARGLALARVERETKYGVTGRGERSDVKRVSVVGERGAPHLRTRGRPRFESGRPTARAPLHPARSLHPRSLRGLELPLAAGAARLRRHGRRSSPGASFTNSPFKLDLANTWFFGEPSAKRRRHAERDQVHPLGRPRLRRTAAADAGVAAPRRGHEAPRRRAAQEALVDLLALGRRR